MIFMVAFSKSVVLQFSRGRRGADCCADGGDPAALEQEVMLALAREQGFPDWYAGAAQALTEALMDKPSPEALYDILAGMLREEASCESSN